VPNFSLDEAAEMAIYKIRPHYPVFFMTWLEMPSRGSYGVSVFRQHHDVYVYIWQRFNVTDFDGVPNTLAERLSWSPLYKWV